jgi:hypothetical protein
MTRYYYEGYYYCWLEIGRTDFTVMRHCKFYINTWTKLKIKTERTNFKVILRV